MEVQINRPVLAGEQNCIYTAPKLYPLNGPGRLPVLSTFVTSDILFCLVPTVVNRKSYHRASSRSNGHLGYIVFGLGPVILFWQILAVNLQTTNQIGYSRRLTVLLILYPIHKAFHYCVTWCHALPNWQISEIQCMPELSVQPLVMSLT